MKDENAELIEMMGPAAASSIGYEPRETEKEKRESKKRRQEFRDAHAPASALRVRSAREAMSGVDVDERTTPSARSGVHPSLSRRGAG